MVRFVTDFRAEVGGVARVDLPVFAVFETFRTELIYCYEVPLLLRIARSKIVTFGVEVCGAPTALAPLNFVLIGFLVLIVIG